ncbi:hypothetical protein DVH24_036054 [Malus domestica]|uniref:Uncharacterized protein n=1 Tax=Malus domestica TaxID=3750 RepID=A0A498KN79_MALDO|nr:hypothetical protein DVH24_036054 [Malus domestica]
MDVQVFKIKLKFPIDAFLKLRPCVKREPCALGDLTSGHEVGGISPSVVGNRISQMISKVLNGALSGDNSLHKEAEH